MLKSLLAASLLALSLTNCTATGPATEAQCVWAKPILVSKADILTEGTARQILEHNRTWKAVCGG